MKLFLLAASALALTAAAPAFPDRNGRAVVDAANVIPEADELALNNKIVAWNKATKHQLVVATLPSLQGYDIKDYGYQLFRSYRLGRKSVDDGVMLILAPAERKVRIEVGGGLEQSLTDGFTSQIVQTTIVPQLKAGDIPAALRDGADKIMSSAQIDEARALTIVDRQKAGSSGWVWWLLGLGGVGGTGWWLVARKRRKERKARVEAAWREADRAREKYLKAKQLSALAGEGRSFATPDRPARPRTETFGTSPSHSSRRHDPVAYVPPVVPVYVPSPPPPPPPPPSPSYSSDWGSSSSSSSSSDSSSSYSSFDSGGGSCSGGGSDSSY